MFAIQCSFCQHENLPGARFCAECGSPLHLRVCPNPKCGKVSDVNATRCEHCGTPLPRIALAEAGATDNKPSPANSDRKPTTSALPLIIVAVAAGGLPLLWLNRAHLPAPKTWQRPQTETVAPAAPPVPIAPPTAKPASVPDPIALPSPQVSAPPEPLAAKPEKPEPVVAAVAVETEAKAQAAEREKPRAKRAAQARKAEQAADEQAAAAPPQPPRPCTEAVAAVGLCDPKQAAK
ncbi:MAG: zinc-ribbon domain-containing protein [Rhodocyclaceae bacterium]|nr:zinc-ribbon domain-containing protein [Rhodocyclaceae bacterium]